jgi:2-isopropylmalate synthase
MLLHTREPSLGLWTGIETTEIARTSRLVSRLTGYQVQPNKAIVGRNAFAHEAGIHQDGYLKERTTYEIIDPKSVGVPEGKLVLGKHSGRHALKARLEDLGFQLSKDELDFVYKEITTLADNKKGLMDEEIAELAKRSQQVTAVSA